ncbi:MAG: hypothetical protein A4E57_04702 [Syntrophorhabdaceae bacterium PtaU1.Bin034]|jgi:uncharacterized protein with von Willebrand factor type A (vWA) domain|nr:MAG: hypothetical protein A4E57_04702 [Syntrophorhabdaceae bacterium PtaU1.Bin034]
MGAKGNLEMMSVCDRCMACSSGEGEEADERTLYELAHMDDKTIANLMNESRYSIKGLHEKAWSYAKKRLEKAKGNLQAKRGELQELKEGFSYKLLEQLAAGGDLDELLEEYLGDDYRKRLEEELAMMDRVEEGLEPEDIRDSLQEFVEKDLIEVNENGVRITPRGSGRLAKYVLRRLWENLSATNTGTNATKEEGFGMGEGFGNRPYEYGDEFFKIDMEATLLSALEKGRNGADRIEFIEDDLRVRETTIDTKLCVGLIVDESGSMSGEKIHAAMDICLALSELIKRNSKDKMRLFLFSNQVREMAYWDVLNMTFAGGTTDMRSALRKFRTASMGENADKQVYLITDTEPNCEDGKYIGFEKATIGVLKEAIIYQREGITLNIIMLDNTPHLREFASILAKRNLGRVFFTEPKELGKVLMEDYLRTRKRQKLRR